jgi:hypothetical protein
MRTQNLFTSDKWEPMVAAADDGDEAECHGDPMVTRSAGVRRARSRALL